MPPEFEDPREREERREMVSAILWSMLAGAIVGGTIGAVTTGSIIAGLAGAAAGAALVLLVIGAFVLWWPL